MVVAIWAARTWIPVPDPWVSFVALLVGAVTGLVAKLYPTLRAARPEPVEAFAGGLTPPRDSPNEEWWARFVSHSRRS